MGELSRRSVRFIVVLVRAEHLKDVVVMLHVDDDALLGAMTRLSALMISAAY